MNSMNPTNQPQFPHLHSTDYLANKIAAWGRARKIIPNSTPYAQASKAAEEVQELLEHTAQWKYLLSTAAAVGLSESKLSELQFSLKNQIKDDIGDVFVCLIMVCELLDVNHQECIQQAYEEIKDRKGEMREGGKFYKEVSAST